MIPYYKQEKDWYCGPAVMQMILASKKIHLSQRDLAKKLKTTKKNGTKNKNLVAFCRRYFVTRVQRRKAITSIKKHLKKSIVIVTYWHLKDMEGHFAIVKTITKNQVILQDPDQGKNYAISRKTFTENWHDSEKNKGWSLILRDQ